MKRLTTEEFIEKARKIHGDKYCYEKTVYQNTRIKIIVTCRIHGDFLVTPNDHLQGVGCPSCNKSFKKTTEQFIEEANKIHDNKYDYSNVKYINNTTKVCIVCKEHGEFWQSPKEHLKGHGCPKCRANFLSEKFSFSKACFIEKAKKIHNNKYDYSKVNYVNNKTKVIITCPLHGDFLQTPKDHLNSKGCPKCNESKLEKEIENLLKKENINFINGYHNELFGRQHLDFYLPDYNAAIECQGIQHFKPIKHFGGNKKFEYSLFNDKKKKEICDKNEIRLFYFSNLKIDYPYEVFENKEELIKEIKNEKYHKVNRI